MKVRYLLKLRKNLDLTSFHTCLLLFLLNKVGS